jgi:hypothetical protein
VVEAEEALTFRNIHERMEWAQVYAALVREGWNAREDDEGDPANAAAADLYILELRRRGGNSVIEKAEAEQRRQMAQTPIMMRGPRL